MCPVCGQPLDPCGVSVCERRQVIDIPLLVLKHIKEYVQHQVTCSCGHRVKGVFPGEERRKLFATFRRGLDKHREHIFLFLSRHNVPYDNNASERALRPVKTKMKVSGLFRSEDGAKNYATLMTIAETAKKNGQNPFFALRELAHYHPEQ